MIFAQLEFLETAINKLDGNPLFWLLLVIIGSVVLMQFKDIFKLFAEAIIKRKEMQIAFEEDSQRQKFERENKVAEALKLNSESLNAVTEYLKDRCNQHKYDLHEAVNNLNIANDEKQGLKKVIDNND